jgi:uncharacterized membrane protein
MEQTIQTLIYIHAFFGGVGLITGMISIFVKKGGINHKKAGKVFSYSMVFSSLLSLFIAWMPNHENLFLFLIGVFTIYMVLSGNRALTLKASVKSEADLIDKSISGTMLLASAVMVGLGGYGVVTQVNNSVLYLFFGVIGVSLTMGDFKTFKTFTQNRNLSVINHIGRMVGAMIASVTAFIVAGLNFEALVFWITPTVLGTGYIVYWVRKFKGVGKVG